MMLDANSRSQNLRERLIEFLTNKLAELNKPLDEPLGDGTSLLQSQLLDSLGLLHLAAWIEENSSAPLDFSEIDPVQEWDTVADIVDFMAARS